MPAAAGLAVAIAQSCGNAESRRLERRSEARKNARQQRDENREGEHPGIEAGISEARYLANLERLDDTETKVSNEQACNGAEPIKQKRLHDDKAHETRAACAESRADSDFAHARGAASKEKIGDVEASDEQKESDGTEENPEGAASGVAGDPSTRRGEDEADAFVFFRKGFPEQSGNLCKVRLGSFLRDTGLQPANDLKFPTTAIGVRAITKRRKKLSTDPGLTGRKNAHDEIGFVIEAEGLAKDVGIASETSLPEFIAEDHDGISESAAVIVVGKIAAKNRGNT